jgi:hypothetical protein
VGSISSTQLMNHPGALGRDVMRRCNPEKCPLSVNPKIWSSFSASYFDGVRFATSRRLTCVCVHPRRAATADCDSCAASRRRRISAPKRTRGDPGPGEDSVPIATSTNWEKGGLRQSAYTEPRSGKTSGRHYLDLFDLEIRLRTLRA